MDVYEYYFIKNAAHFNLYVLLKEWYLILVHTLRFHLPFSCYSSLNDFIDIILGHIMSKNNT